jgi:hypothetical protein
MKSPFVQAAAFKYPSIVVKGALQQSDAQKAG